MSSKETQQNRTHEKLLRRHKSAAFKHAAALFAEQEAKDAGERRSLERVMHIVDSEYGKGMPPRVRSIQRNVKAGIIEVSPVKISGAEVHGHWRMPPNQRRHIQERRVEGN